MNKLLAILLLLSVVPAFAQKKNGGFVYHIQKTTSALNIDGVADEATWKATAATTPFYAVLPMDSGLA